MALTELGARKIAAAVAIDTEMVDAIPFGIWVDQQIKRLMADETSDGGQCKLAEQLGVGESWLHKGAWRRRLTVERHVVEDALHRAGVGWWEVYDEEHVDAHVRSAWCGPCAEQVTTVSGICPWCESLVAPQFDASSRQPPKVVPPLASERERRSPLRAGEEWFGLVCVCGRGKSKQARSCKPCFLASGKSGGRGVPRLAMRGPYGVSEDQMAEARRVYEAEQVSLREIARRIYPETYGYLNERSLSGALYRGFRNREWPCRTQSDAVKLRNWKHGRKLRAQTDEEQNAYRRWLADQRGWKAVQHVGNPTCSGVRATSPRKGAPCSRPAMDGSDFCFSHDPARAEQRASVLEAARATQTPAERRKNLERARARKAKKVARKGTTAYDGGGR